ncbi:hypothetical protein SAMN04487949_2910 [Halogranum gelatinilyticum]|uniref:Uncharacterized protein n=1 Tax=Halogranum gelatinilyticum TaxID=660521 RepID=A0A1G9XAE6_9EURY|nr:hypothetical protein [Halogranum gelatinilyticum]SDM93752.1 hypothetical protein SAMN04487949_2910 [Halogranum gelatinilyticum]
MDTDDTAAARRIMTELGEESRIPYLNIDEADVGVLIALPVAGLLFAGLVGVESLALPLLVGGAGLASAIIYITPRHLTAPAWLGQVWHYLKRPSLSVHAPPGEPVTPTDDRVPFMTGERTQELTSIERAWSGANAVQRTDGAMEAFVEVTPGNMDFAMSDDWATLQAAGAEFANNEVSWKLKFHATTQSFPVESIVERIDGRLSDEDVGTNPVFETLLEEYREQRPAEMRSRGIQQVRYFIGIEVHPLEVYQRNRREATPAERLTELPVVGVLFTPFVTRREDLTESERRSRMLETLDKRLRAVQSEFIQKASGWSARRLSTVELFTLNWEYWNGVEHRESTPESIVREQPVVGDSTRRDDNE